MLDFTLIPFKVKDMAQPFNLISVRAYSSTPERLLARYLTAQQ